MSEIEVRHLSKTFYQGENKVEAVKDVSLSIEHGDIYGVIGMSGAGKSTLVRCLNYLEQPTEGEVLIEGVPLSSLTEKQLRQQRSKIGMIFQHFNLLMQKNVIDNISFPLVIQGVKKKDARKRAAELLETVGLTDKAAAYPAQLSGGQKQRVAIARALASDPKILLCDEATSALDPQTTASILELLKKINQEFGITIVIITHQMAVVREICTKVAIFSSGEAVEVGSVEEIFNHPKTRAAKELLAHDGGEEQWEGASRQQELLETDRKIRVVYSENSAFEPVVANMVLVFGTPVNILKANTRNVGGVAKGEIILGLPEKKEVQDEMIDYLKTRGLEVEEVSADVE
jgi:D-methionine transport system ATP-binding protein